MKKQVQRALATIAVTVVLGLGGGALATPAAAADVDADVLGGTVKALVSNAVAVGTLGATILNFANPIAGIA
ncbi:hypothetical protein [Streptomyces sp. NPDC001404]|uniref:hypothetical protein n=1 Tax=Streptomyces sp. NPDC001404 TaxID=3364571 RepID=UPI0036CD129E